MAEKRCVKGGVPKRTSRISEPEEHVTPRLGYECLMKSSEQALENRNETRNETAEESFSVSSHPSRNAFASRSGHQRALPGFQIDLNKGQPWL
jgi:hypothetical protein